MRSLDAKNDEVTALLNLERVEADGCRFLIRVVVGERTKIVKAHKPGGSVAHAREVEIFFDPPDERLGKRRPPPGDLVDVAPAPRAVASVEGVAYLRM